MLMMFRARGHVKDFLKPIMIDSVAAKFFKMKREETTCIIGILKAYRYKSVNSKKARAGGAIESGFVNS